MHDTCELAEVTPTRFIGLVVRPLGETSKATEMGRVMGTLMSDQVTLKVDTIIQVFPLTRIFNFFEDIEMASDMCLY